jgi:hypothetical protein
VVIEKVDQHSPVMTEGMIEPALAPKEMLVLPCEGIDPPVKQNPLFNTGRETAVQLPFDKITHQISNKESRRTAGEIQVGKKVHKPISYPSPFRTAMEKKSIV